MLRVILRVFLFEFYIRGELPYNPLMLCGAVSRVFEGTWIPSPSEN